MNMADNTSKNIREELVEFYGDPDLLFADGFDDCIVGVTNSFDTCQKVVYNIEKMINSLMKEGMSEHEALEYFDFNIAGAYVGERTPLYIHVYGK